MGKKGLAHEVRKKARPLLVENKAGIQKREKGPLELLYSEEERGSVTLEQEKSASAL